MGTNRATCIFHYSLGLVCSEEFFAIPGEAEAVLESPHLIWIGLWDQPALVTLGISLSSDGKERQSILLGTR